MKYNILGLIVILLVDCTPIPSVISTQNTSTKAVQSHIPDLSVFDQAKRGLFENIRVMDSASAGRLFTLSKGTGYQHAAEDIAALELKTLKTGVISGTFIPDMHPKEAYFGDSSHRLPTDTMSVMIMKGDYYWITSISFPHVINPTYKFDGVLGFMLYLL